MDQFNVDEKKKFILGKEIQNLRPQELKFF